MEAYRRDRLTPWEASLLLVRAGKAEPGGAALPALSFSLLFVVVSSWLGATARHSLVPISARAFFTLAILSTGITSLMATFERGRAEALRFLQVTPQPIATKWLLFLPFGVAGILVALASLTVMPPLAALTLLGCWCWATAVGHWCAGRALHILMAGWLLSFVPVVVAALTCDSGSWAPAAATAVALGSIGWLTSPRDRVSLLPSRAGAARGRSRARPVRHSAHRWTALRILFLSEIPARRWSRWLFLYVILLAIIAFVTPLMTILGVLHVFSGSGFLAGANTRAALDFLATRPISRSQRLRGLILPWFLLAAFVPTCGLLGARTATTVERSELRQLAYPRDVIRSALDLTPTMDVAPGTNTIAVSPALRRLLLSQVGRVALLEIGLFACASAWHLSNAQAPRRRRQRRMNIALTVVSFGLLVPFWTRFGFRWGQLPWTPSFWLVAPVVALGVLALMRQVAQLHASPSA